MWFYISYSSLPTHRIIFWAVWMYSQNLSWFAHCHLSFQPVSFYFTVNTSKVRIVLLSSMTMQNILQWIINVFPHILAKVLVGSFSEQWWVFPSVTEIAYIICQVHDCNAFVYMIAKFWVFLPKVLCILHLSAIIFNFQDRGHDRLHYGWCVCVCARVCVCVWRQVRNSATWYLKRNGLQLKL
jgi:hypothetical protein